MTLKNLFSLTSFINRHAVAIYLITACISIIAFKPPTLIQYAVICSTVGMVNFVMLWSVNKYSSFKANAWMAEAQKLLTK